MTTGRTPPAGRARHTLVALVGSLALVGLSTARAERIEASPPDQGFDGWALAGLSIEQRDGRACRLVLLHRRLVPGDESAEVTASIAATPCVSAAADASDRVLAPAGQVAVGIETCVDGDELLAGVGLVTARVHDGAVVRVRPRTRWAGASCAHWLPPSRCAAGEVVYALTTPLEAPLTGALAVRCRRVPEPRARG